MLLKPMVCGNLTVGLIYEGHLNALQLIQTFNTREQITLYARYRHKIFSVWNDELFDSVKVIPLDPC